jgi:hypothetical protein
MVKIVQDKEARIKLQRGNKIIDRSLKDYQANKSVYDFRGFKPVQDVVKETKVEQPKKRKTRKKKDEQVDLETSEKMD